MIRRPDINSLFEDQDIEGLIRALRFPGSPEVRAEAARALGALNNFEAVESLAHSSRRDPDISVRKAALEALHELLGNTAESIIATYGPLPGDEPWIPASGPAEPATEESAARWNREDIPALFSILRTEKNVAMRLRAIQALSQIDSTEAIDALVKVALWEEDDASSEAAAAVLEEKFGEDLPEVLESYQEGAAGDEGEWDLEAEESSEDEDVLPEEKDVPAEEEPVAEAQPEETAAGLEVKSSSQVVDALRPAPVNAQIRKEPVIQEVKAGWTTALLIGLLLLAAVAVIIYLLTR
jgi:hypothetical protein